MTGTELSLARRLVASPKWRWMAGMRVEPVDDLSDCCRLDGILLDGIRLVDEAEWTGSFYDNNRVARIRVVDSEDDMVGGEVPDLADAATQGCLFDMLGDDLVRFAHRSHAYGGEKWTANVLVSDCRIVSRTGPTRGEALARALLAAWGEERG